MDARINYFASGVKKGFRASRTLSFFERVLFTSYIIVSSLFRFSLFLAPIFAVADVNLGKMIDKNEAITFGGIFSNCLRRNRFFELFTFFLIKRLVLFGILVAINIPTAFIFGFGSFTSQFYRVLPFAIAVAVICGVASLIVVFIASLYFAPAAYVSSCGEKGYFSDIVHNSYNGVKGHLGKLFGLYIKYALFAFAIIFPTLGVAIILFIFTEIEGAIAGTLLIVLFLFLSYFLLTSIYSSFQTSKFMYYKVFVPTEHSFVIKNAEASDVDEDEEEEDEESDDESMEEDDQQ